MVSRRGFLKSSVVLSASTAKAGQLRTGVLWMTGSDDSYVRQSLPFLRDLRLDYEEMDRRTAARALAANQLRRHHENPF